MPSIRPGLKAELGEEHLKLGDVIAAQHRTCRVEQSLTQLPPGFAEALVGDGVDDSGEGESARALERLDEGDRLIIKDRRRRWSARRR